jgi:hypothetical protein
MTEKRCERCGARTPTPKASPFALFDYCVSCGRDLCDACLAKGCCGKVPAEKEGD